MLLGNLLTAETVMADIEVADKEGVLRQIVNRLKEHNLVKDGEGALKALIEREKLGSTAIGNHVAIPHAKCEGIDHLVVAFAKSAEGVDFDSLDRKKVHYIFLLLAPKGEPEKHLKILARISRLYREERFREQLEKLNGAVELLNMIKSVEQSL